MVARRRRRRRGRGRHYLPRGGEQAWRAPSSFTNVELYAFGVPCDPALVHEMWRRYVGDPSRELGLHVDVRGTSIRHVLFVFLESERRQLVEHAGGVGFRGNHREQMFAVVVFGYRVAPDPAWVLFMPYVFASDAPGWSSDREIYGFPRQFGHVSIEPATANLRASLSVEARAIERFREDAWAQPMTILRVSGPPKSVAGRRGVIANELAAALGADDAVLFEHSDARTIAQTRFGVTAADRSFIERFTAAANGPVPTARILSSLRDALSSRALPALFLKQFRDVLFADRACYQAIVEATFSLGRPIASAPLDGYELSLKDIDSVPIARELGIPISEQGKVRVNFGFRIELDKLSVHDPKVISNPDWNPAVEFSATDEPSRLPVYVDRGGEAVWRQPSRLIGANIIGFGVPVSVEQQRAVLDRLVNKVVADSNSTYGSKPLCLHPCEGVDMVMLLFVEYDRIASGDVDDSRLGGNKYREFLLTQLAISDDDEFPELDWFIPYICLDVDAPRLGGREIYGYPKQLARMEFASYPGKDLIAPAKSLTVNATVFPRPVSAASARDVVIVEHIGKSAPVVTPYREPADMFLDILKSSQPAGARTTTVGERLFPCFAPGADRAPGAGVAVLNALLFNRVGDVFLKEFRDCEDPNTACYQAICKTDMIPARFHGGGRVDPSDYRITIADIASEPLRSYLLPLGATQREGITPRFAYVLNLDLDLTAGRVIANPMAADVAVADVSMKRTIAERKEIPDPKETADPPPRPQRRRVASFVEPYWRQSLSWRDSL